MQTSMNLLEQKSVSVCAFCYVALSSTMISAWLCHFLWQSISKILDVDAEFCDVIKRMRCLKNEMPSCCF